MLHKTDITEILGREVDEIEDIRRCFEGAYTNHYFIPQDGDHISDDYAKIIDLTTQPGILGEGEVRSLNHAVMHLNEVYPTIERRLGKAGLLEIYLDVAAQINTVNANDHNRSKVVKSMILDDSQQ